MHSHAGSCLHVYVSTSLCVCAIVSARSSVSELSCLRSYFYFGVQWCAHACPLIVASAAVPVKYSHEAKFMLLVYVCACLLARPSACLFPLSLKSKGLGTCARRATMYWKQKRHLPDQLVGPYDCRSFSSSCSSDKTLDEHPCVS